MRRPRLILTLLVAAAAVSAAAVSVHPAHGVPAATVASITDGDTLRLTSGARVRLFQIDTPELGGECYSARGRAGAGPARPPGTRVGLEADPRLDGVDATGGC